VVLGGEFEGLGEGDGGHWRHGSEGWAECKKS
jgi:hypothetical protein